MCPVEKLPELFFSLLRNTEIIAVPKSIFREIRIPKMMTIRSKNTIKFA
jgi:hypothetical protein